MPKLTPLYPRTAALCRSQKWQLWEDYLIADSYDFSLADEYCAIRHTAAAFDFSPLYIYHFTGSDALSVINRIVTRDISSCPLHGARYTAWCNEKGKVIDEGVIIRLDVNCWQISANTNNMAWFGSFIKNKKLNVTLTDKSTDIVTIPVQGPVSASILNSLSTDSIYHLEYFSWMQTTINRRIVGLSRTGYTGDLGYEIWCKKEDSLGIWDALMNAGIKPCGFSALDIARIEAGLIWCGYDYSSANIVNDDRASWPGELNLDRVVNTKKEFVGRQAILSAQESSDSCVFTGFVFNIENVSSTDFSVQEMSLPWRRKRKLVTSNGDDAGYISSGTMSPLLNSMIALGKIKRKYFNDNVYMELVTNNGKINHIPVERTELPFLSFERKIA